MASKVLLVDDNEDIRDVLKQVLALEGLEVECAEHGVAALERLRAGFRPDVILLDLMMPVMNGIEFLRVLRADRELGASRVLVLTAFSRMAKELKSAGLAVEGLLEKPVDYGALLAAINLRPAEPAAP